MTAGEREMILMVAAVDDDGSAAVEMQITTIAIRNRILFIK